MAVVEISSEEKALELLSINAGRRIEFAQEKRTILRNFCLKFPFLNSVVMCSFLWAVEWMGRAAARRTWPKLPRAIRG